MWSPPLCVNEAEFLELVHKQIHSRPRCANHFRQRLLRYFGQNLLGLVFLSVASEQ